jgi:hypothetical protein
MLKSRDILVDIVSAYELDDGEAWFDCRQREQILFPAQHPSGLLSSG